MNKYFYLILLCVSFVSIQLTGFGETFQNSLLRMDFCRTSSGDVKIALYTSKPYEDSITVNKKSDFEYVILLPETSNAMTANPVLNSVIGIVKAVNLRTQQYENEIKGYTKITISTIKPVEIIPQIQTLSGSAYQLSEKDYNELLSQTTSKKLETPVKKEIKPQYPKKITNKPAVINKLVQKPKPVLTYAPAKIERKSHKTQLSKVASKKSRPYKSNASLAKHIAVKPKIAQTPRIVAKKSQIAGTGSSIHTELQSKPDLKQKNRLGLPAQHHETGNALVSTHYQQSVVSPVIQKDVYTPADGTPKNKVEVPKTETGVSKAGTEVQTPPPIPEKVSAPVQKISTFSKYKNIAKNIIKNNLYTILGLISGALILLLLIVRKSFKNTGKRKEPLHHLNEKPSAVKDYSENINEDMTWKEKFQTYVDTVQKSSSETGSDNVLSAAAVEEIDELFKDEFSEEDVPEDDISEDTLPEENIDEPISDEDIQNEAESYEFADENEIPENELSQEEILEQDKLDELFDSEDAILNEEDGSIFSEENFAQENFPFEEYENEVEESSDEVIKSEFAIDADKGFYLVDFEDKTALVGHIEDEIFILKQFKEKIEGTLQARMDERKQGSINYMTKVGDFRALVEVTPTNMNLLIEL